MVHKSCTPFYDRRWLSFKQACVYLGFEKRKLRALMKSGMPFYRLDTGTLRFRTDELDIWMQKFAVNHINKQIIKEDIAAEDAADQVLARAGIYADHLHQSKASTKIACHNSDRNYGAEGDIVNEA